MEKVCCLYYIGDPATSVTDSKFIRVSNSIRAIQIAVKLARLSAHYTQIGHYFTEYALISEYNSYIALHSVPVYKDTTKYWKLFSTFLLLKSDVVKL